MAGKLAAPAAHFDDKQRLEDMEFEIEGLTALGDGRFVCKDVPVINVDYQAIERIVTDAGVESTDAMYVTEAMATKLHEITVGRLFARRAKRVG
jgi:hypothetical protein